MNSEFLSQLREAFLVESEEGLATMESCLLHLQEAPQDMDSVHAVFRAIHSIKGGAPTVGFQQVVGVAHEVESYLDRVREGRVVLSGVAVGTLLELVDELRAILEAEKNGKLYDLARVGTLVGQLSEPAASEGERATAPGAAQSRHRIRFAPYREVMSSGNDPLRTLEELQRVVPFEARLDLGQLPPLAELDPNECHAAWELTTTEPRPHEQIREVFAWIEMDCDLAIEPIAEVREQSNTQSSSGLSAGSIRVQTEKIDELMNLVGELVINQAMLAQLGRREDAESRERLLSGLTELERNTRELQDNVMRIRMVPMRFLFSRYPRMVRDLGDKLDKRVHLELAGEATELDKTLIERLTDPLTHLVRNAVDHGLEGPDDRAAAGKDPTGKLKLEASHQGDKIVIEVRDDGRGIDPEKVLRKARDRGVVSPTAQLSTQEIQELLFEPGFSTADSVSDVSGRGVGLDVVRKNIQAMGGSLEVRSRPGEGTAFFLKLPLTLAIVDGQLVRVRDQIFVVPLLSISESVQVSPDRIRTLTGGEAEVLHLRDRHVPILHLSELFDLGVRQRAELVVIVDLDGRKSALVVDELLGQQQVVVKSLEDNYQRVPGIAGATILGDGRVALILEISELVARRSAGVAEGERVHV